MCALSPSGFSAPGTEAGPSHSQPDRLTAQHSLYQKHGNRVRRRGEEERRGEKCGSKCISRRAKKARGFQIIWIGEAGLFHAGTQGHCRCPLCFSLVGPSLPSVLMGPAVASCRPVWKYHRHPGACEVQEHTQGEPSRSPVTVRDRRLSTRSARRIQGGLGVKGPAHSEPAQHPLTLTSEGPAAPPSTPGPTQGSPSSSPTARLSRD